MLPGKQEWYRDATDYSKMAADCSKTSKSTVPAPSHDSTLGGALVLHGTDGLGERAARSPLDRSSHKRSPCTNSLTIGAIPYHKVTIFIIQSL